MTKWEKQKAYAKRRAAALGKEMDQAIEAFDRDRFEQAHSKAVIYMSSKERGVYHRRYLEAIIKNRRVEQ